MSECFEEWLMIGCYGDVVQVGLDMGMRDSRIQVHVRDRFWCTSQLPILYHTRRSGAKSMQLVHCPSGPADGLSRWASRVGSPCGQSSMTSRFNIITFQTNVHFVISPSYTCNSDVWNRAVLENAIQITNIISIVCNFVYDNAQQGMEERIYIYISRRRVWKNIATVICLTSCATIVP